MTINAHVFPSFTEALALKEVDIGVDAISVLLVGAGNYLGGTAGALNATVEAMTNKASVLANGSAALTELASGNGYTTGGIALTAGDFAVNESTLYTTITYSGTIQWTSATFTAYQAVWYDTTYNQAVCYWDFGGPQSCSSGTFTLTLGTANGIANSLVQYTAS